MTLIEVMVAVLIMTVAAQILSSILAASISYSVSKRERGLAVEGAMNVIEEMHATPFYDVFAEFNMSPDDDPGGAGTGHGAQFQIEGLQAIDGEPFVATVVFPERGGQLLETIENEELGMPRDLNGDLLIDDDDHAGNYLLIPTVVTVRWKSRYGNRTLSLGTMLADVGKEDEE